MSKDPAVLFYTSDFLGSTFHLSDEQVGKLIRLLCMQHQRGRLSERDLPYGDNEEAMQVRSFFKRDENGFYNERMEEEIIKRKSYTQSRRLIRAKRTENAEKRNELGALKAEENEENAVNDEKDKVTSKDDFALQLFDEFWDSYPKKIGKEYAKKCFLRLNPSRELASLMIDALNEQRKWDMWVKDGGQYIPNPSTWINQKRWLDSMATPVTEEKRIGIYI